MHRYAPIGVGQAEHAGCRCRKPRPGLLLDAADQQLRQLEDAQKEITRLKTTGRHLQQQEEDLKALLQQFTRDSRDMMACIQELEQENQRLRERLPESPQPGGAPDPAEAAPSAGPLADDPLPNSV